MDFSELIRAFGISGTYQGYEELFVGNINQTYKLRFLTEDGQLREYILQRLNTYVFKNPREVMENIRRVTGHIRQRLGENSDRRVLHFRTAQDGAPYVENETGFWRAYRYIDRALTYDTVSAAHFEQAGYAFGRFQGDLADFPVETLHETIPHFHDTPDRMRQLHDAIREDKAGRAASVQPEIRFILDREQDAGAIVEALDSGRIPLRVTHNDTKINNVLFSPEDNRAMVVIDLDTVMPGLMGHDFGDAIRFAANFVEEDCPEADKAGVDLDVFRTFAHGFLSQTAKTLTDTEADTLAMSCFVLTAELATRFLADYLDGDLYFNTKYPGHNLVRARCQIALAKDMLAKMPQMEAIVRECVRNFQ